MQMETFQLRHWSNNVGQVFEKIRYSVPNLFYFPNCLSFSLPLFLPLPTYTIAVYMLSVAH
jgi:hypothetical protein